MPKGEGLSRSGRAVMFKIILIIIKDPSITGEKYPFVLNVEELIPSRKAKSIINLAITANQPNLQGSNICM